VPAIDPRRGQPLQCIAGGRHSLLFGVVSHVAVVILISLRRQGVLKLVGRDVDAVVVTSFASRPDANLVFPSVGIKGDASICLVRCFVLRHGPR
jgi:hypothetical protein